ncbi:hypothetical protein LB507_009122 [Fusarium sp. FIESC RH6]|nr:hypothetical protein LB507_009122 [Fusarium sp. FIESC RH6]
MDTSTERLPFTLPHCPAPSLGSGALCIGASPSGPDPENEKRLEYAKDLEKYVQESLEGFILRCEHAAAILLAPMYQFKERGGALWTGPDTLVTPDFMKERLNGISTFCRHYMLHLDPKNLEDPKWQHAIPVPLRPEPDPHDVALDDPEGLQRAFAYQCRFETDPDLPGVPLVKQRMEEAECRRLNEDKCVVTGQPKPHVFWIFPSTWNDTVDHMDATGDLRSACRALTGISLLDEPDPPCSARELGTTHKSCYMMCLHPILYKYLKKAWCAFKYLFHRDDNNNNVKVTLEFHWMPKLLPLFGEPIDDIDEFWTLLSEQMGQFDNCIPPPGLEYGQIGDKSGELLKTGYHFDVLVPRQHLARFQSGIDVLWACARFTALCGAAGRPWLLSGMDPGDESMRERQKEAVSQDNQRLGWRSKASGNLKDTGK